MADDKDMKKMNEGEVKSKIIELKIELLKNPMKKKSIKREIARLLTMGNQTKLSEGLSTASLKKGDKK